jgi:Rieske Fe-S protein
MNAAHEGGPVPGRGVTRRCLLAVGAVGIPGLALVGCSQAAAPGGPAGAAGSSGAAKPLAKLSDIKVGEAISATGPDGGDIVIVRPTESTVTAFSAICTHEGCTVRPAGQELDCPCHGSVFDLKGAVLNGPAQRPLRPVKVTLSGDDVMAG